MVCVSCSQHIWIATATSILKQSTPKQHFRSENKAHHTATIATFVRPYMETARESVSESGSHWYVRFFFHMPASKACLIAKALVKWNSSQFASFNLKNTRRFHLDKRMQYGFSFSVLHSHSSVQLPHVCNDLLWKS